MGYAGGYQQQDNMRGSSEGRDRFQGEEEGGGMSNYNWMKMQMGL